MNYHSPGVLENSKIYLYNASRRARDIFYYLLCIGRYSCTVDYTVSRQRYDSFLLIYVISGEGKVLCKDGLKTIGAGTFAFLDCYQAHSYMAKEQGWEILWMHMDGKGMRSMYDEITDQGEKILLTVPNPFLVERNLLQIYELFDQRKRINEARISQFITNILTELYIARNSAEATEAADRIEDILTYISMHIDQPISVEDLSDQAHLSPYYFSRLFKQNTGFSPHEYITNHRISNAKFLLRTTDFSIKKIALCCGYPNVSGFCTNFKKHTQASPLQYRLGQGEA